jgi:glycine cleavage system H lipoate-binding protein
MKGKLIEINESVVKNPRLIQTSPTTDGHIGLILPKLPDGLAELKARLISKSEYQVYISSKMES